MRNSASLILQEIELRIAWIFSHQHMDLEYWNSRFLMLLYLS